MRKYDIIKGEAMKSKVNLVCSECLRSNYSTNKSNLKRIQIKKFCRSCNKHTIHKENK